MNKHLLRTLVFTVVCCLLSVHTHSQNIPNGSFENWVPLGGTGLEVPQSWGTITQALFDAGRDTFALEAKDTTAANLTSGNYSCKITTDSVNTPQHDLVQGFLNLGSLVVDSAGLARSGIPFTYRPDTLFFSYHYSSPGTDTAVAEIDLTSATNGYILTAGFLLTANAQMQTFFVPLSSYYFNGAYPDTLMLAFASSNETPVLGSTLWIDDVRFGYVQSANVVVAAGNTVLCAGDSTQICAPAGYTSYLWNTGETTQCITTQNAGNYWVTVTDVSSVTAVSNHLAISVLPLPAVSISVNGDTLVGYNAVSYQWFLNGVLLTGANTNTFIATVSGAYSLGVTDTNGCFAMSVPVIITGPSCAAAFFIYPDTVAQHWFVYNMTSGAEPITYTWDWGDSSSDTGAYPSHTFAAAGNFNICLSIADSTGCTSTYCDSSTYIYKTDAGPVTLDVVNHGPATGISEFRIQHSTFSIYPNPANNYFSISVDESMIGSKLSVNDVTGREVMSSAVQIRNQQFAIQNFSNGVYLVTLENERGRATKKLIIEK